MAKLSNKKAKTEEIVLSALKKLMKNTGWSTRTIIKFIKLEYGIADPWISRKVSRALKRGVRTGLMQGENGRYRLCNKAFLSKRIVNKQRRRRNDGRSKR